MDNTTNKLTCDAIGHMCQELEEINVPRAAITVAKTYMWELAKRLQPNVNVNVQEKPHEKRTALTGKNKVSKKNPIVKEVQDWIEEETPKTKRWNSYADYLKSTEWENLKIEYQNTIQQPFGDDCTICFLDKPLVYHHWKYPRDWNDDCKENLVHMCSDCHSYVHSLTTMESFSPDAKSFYDRNEFIYIFIREKFRKINEFFPQDKLVKREEEYNNLFRCLKLALNEIDRLKAGFNG